MIFKSYFSGIKYFRMSLIMNCSIHLSLTIYVPFTIIKPPVNFLLRKNQTVRGVARQLRTRKPGNPWNLIRIIPAKGNEDLFWKIKKSVNTVSLFEGNGIFVLGQSCSEKDEGWFPRLFASSSTLNREPGTLNLGRTKKEYISWR